MGSIKVLVVEDSEIIAEDIVMKLQKHRFEVLKVFDRGEDAIAFLKEHDADLVLLDIRLAGALDGIATAYMINQLRSLPIIYLSDLADSDTVNRAKQTRPANYITKPFHEADLVRAIDIAFSNFTALRQGSAGPSPDHIFVKSENAFVRISLADIIYLHADRSYCHIVTAEKSHVISTNMNNVFEQINHKDFLRIHRSYVINVKKITAIDGNVVFLGRHTVEMSKSMRDELIGRLTFLKP